MPLFVANWPVETDGGVDDAKRFLQRAIELEHAIIPPYLTALYSLVPGRNDEIAAVLRSVVTEEMAHMALAANILSAIGGDPSFTGQHFIPRYPSRLPYHIGGPAFEVPLAPFSLDLVKNIFMVVEQPEFQPHKGHTVGNFYATIRKKLRKAGAGAFIGNPKNQLSIPYGAVVITSLRDANRAIDAIVRQGEGTRQDPLTGPAGELAHYWRFAGIINGYTLVGDPTQPKPPYFAFTGLPIPFDPTGVIPIVSNARPAMYNNDAQAARVSAQFNGLYATMLQLLEGAYQGNAALVTNITGLMFDMKIIAQRLMSIQIKSPTGYGPTTYAAPTFSV